MTSSSSTSSSSQDTTESESTDCDQVRVKHSKRSSTNPQQSEKTSALFDIFQKHYNSLVTMMGSCVSTIACKLYSKALISDDVLDQITDGHDTNSIKASKLVNSVKQRIKLNPEELKMFVQVFKEEPVLDSLTKEIEGLGINRYSAMGYGFRVHF